MTPALTAFIQLLKKEKWSHRVTDDSTVWGHVDGVHLRWDWYATAGEGAAFLYLAGLAPFYVPPGQRLLAAEYLARANFCIKWGNFDLDFSDGEVAFRTAVPLCGRRTPSLQQMQFLLRGNCWAMETYVGGLTGVCFGQASPAEAIEQAQRAWKRESEDESEEAKALPQSILARLRPSQN